MRSKILAGVLVLFVVAGAAFAAVRAWPLSFLPGKVTPIVGAAPPLPNNSIARENAQPGTLDWKISREHRATTQIQAYAGATSTAPGQTLSFYVSTGAQGQPANRYKIDFYRLGWYNSLGGRLMGSTDYFPGLSQGYYNANLRQTVGCPTCTPTTTSEGPYEALWQKTNDYKIPDNWVSGIYLAKFTDANGWQTYTTFTVTNPNSTSDFIAVTPDTTYAAYNDWGSPLNFSTSLYNFGAGGTGAVEGGSGAAYLSRSAKVSFNKPYPPNNSVDGGSGDGASQVLLWEIQAVKWMERQNYDVTYVSDVDLQTGQAALLKKHKAYISLGHDEYWTREMRDAVEQARDSGVGLLFMGANASYWQMRFENNNRWVVSYKVEDRYKDYARDPFYGKDNTRVTTYWRDPVVNRPEDELIGIMFSNLVHRTLGVQVQGYPWKVAQSNSPLLKGTGLQAGQLYGCGLVGYEWDNARQGGHPPANLQILGTSPTLPDSSPNASVGNQDVGNTTYYVAPSGALVFASGSIYWATALDDYRYQIDTACGAKSRPVAGGPTIVGDVLPGMSARNQAVPAIQALMKNVMDQLLLNHKSGNLG